MSQPASDLEVVILSSSWKERGSELAYVTRSVAGALSRCGKLTIFVQSGTSGTEPDGAFDVVGLEPVTNGHWRQTDPKGESRPNTNSTWIVDQPSPDAIALVRTLGSQRAIFSIARVVGGLDSGLRPLPLTPAAAPTSIAFGPYVPINPLASTYRHTGFGFTDYILVLTDRPGHPSCEEPTPHVAWLTSRFYDQYVIVLEGGRAAAWKGRALRGIVDVHTRTDLWRLLAHAKVTVDLSPGNIIARECLESLRFGTPIVVPAGSVGAEHGGSASTYADAADLLERVGLLLDESERQRFSRQGLEYAAFYADPCASVERMARILQTK
jgi:hypothetical protein